MKRLYLISILLGLGIIYAYPQDSIVAIPDTAFLYALIDEGVDANGDSLISFSEAKYNEANPPFFYVLSLNLSGRGITDLSGIEAFSYLDTLWCEDNQLTSLDLSENKLLRVINCSGNQLTNLDVSGSEELVDLRCANNQLTSLDVSGKFDLRFLECYGNQITSLDVSNTTSLIRLNCLANELISLDVSACINLEFLQCRGNQLTNLNVSNCKAMEYLDCGRGWGHYKYHWERFGNQLTSLDVSSNTALTTLFCNYNNITSLDVSGCTGLKTLNCCNNQLTSLDVSGCTSIYSLSCSDNYLTSLQVTNIASLQHIYCNNNQLSSLDISNTGIGICGISSLELTLRHMPMLNEVCVSNGFHLDSINLDTTGSPNVYFTKECTVGIEEAYLPGLSIYPNPANDQLTIETLSPDNYSINITSTNGQLIRKEEMEGNTHQLDLSPFPKGVYFITIRSKDFISARKVVKL